MEGSIFLKMTEQEFSCLVCCRISC